MNGIFDLRSQAIALQAIMIALRPKAQDLAITEEYNKLSEVLQAWYKMLEEDDDDKMLNSSNWEPLP